MILAIGVVIGLAGGVVVGRQYQLSQSYPLSGSDTHQIRQGGYSLINPLLECEIGNERLTKKLTSFKYKIEQVVDRLQQSGSVSEMSVYFRDLNNGLWFGIDESANFTPASLLKLPIMLAYYKYAEKDPKILGQKITLTDTEDRNIMETVRPRIAMKFGEAYTVEDLLFRMIVYSDNNAMALLVGHIPIEIQDEVFTDLGITIPGIKGSEDYMSVAEYASFFRILYNASYLTKQYSQKALSLLSKVDFDNGIRSGVPDKIVVANKFGERVFGEKQQVHDCGIVYYERRPYLLCVMSRGTSFNALTRSIEEVSKAVYQEVDSQGRR